MTRYRINRFLLVISLFLCTSVLGQLVDNFMAKDPCVEKTTCRECAQINTCAWCMQEHFGDKPRCFQPSSDTTLDGCDDFFIWNPENEQSNIVDWALTEVKDHSASSDGFQHIVQIRPQHINLQMRPNKVHELKLEYSQADEFHIDLYFLIDSSKSMKDEWYKINILADTFVKEITSLTHNFKFGVGSFVNEIIVPSSSSSSGEIEMCENCNLSYGFKNLMPLTKNPIKFYETILNATLSENPDAPKPGLDAILQVLECQEKIGWTQHAKRILIYLTAAGFESLEDGKLGKNNALNDEYCHLDEEGSYTHVGDQNYPSISQINQKVRENSVNIIFAVTSKQVALYNDLSHQIEGSSIGVLLEDSSNVFELVGQIYKKIRASIEMKDTAPNSVNITYFSSCLNNEKRETNKCYGLHFGDVVTFTAEIVVTSCPENLKEWHEPFVIYPVGIDQHASIRLDVLCECPCEKTSSPFYQESPAYCSYSGIYKCGKCECYDGFHGKYCQCDTSGRFRYSNRKCLKDNKGTHFCSGRGNCKCGSCECDQRENPEEEISGEFCECDNFSCDRHNQLLCSGPDHGLCECGACVCKPGWSGSACECRATNETCISPDGGEICSGHGECVCGNCRCKATEEGRYFGEYCEECLMCPQIF